VRYQFQKDVEKSTRQQLVGEKFAASSETAERSWQSMRDRKIELPNL
jgi:hypothetical protein